MASTSDISASIAASKLISLAAARLAVTSCLSCLSSSGSFYGQFAAVALSGFLHYNYKDAECLWRDAFCWMVARRRSTILNMKCYVIRRNQYEAVVQRSSVRFFFMLELTMQPSCFRLDKHYSRRYNITERRTDSDVDLPRRLWSHKMVLGICVRVRACVCVEQL